MSGITDNETELSPKPSPQPVPRRFKVVAKNIDSMADIVAILEAMEITIDLPVGEYLKPSFQRLINRGVVDEI